MKKIFFIIFCVCTLLLTACGKKTTQEFIGDNMNTPFIEISPELQKKVEKAFVNEEIIGGQTIEGRNYSLKERRRYNTINWQENMTNWENNKDYHYWFTCYYEKDEVVVFHVEKTLKEQDGGQKAIAFTQYVIGDYTFRIYGPTLQNYTYILVYQKGNLYELDYAFNNGIINGNDVKEIYKHYIDSKFLKYDSRYNDYKYDPENIPGLYD